MQKPSVLIAAKRKALPLSMEEAASLAGISKQGWWLIENGTIENPQMDTCLGIARALQCELSDLWGWAMKPRAATK